MNNQKLAAHVAVEAATYAIDKPYEYLVPEELMDSVVPGVRVRVGFGRGNRRTEGVVLDVHALSEDKKIRFKPIIEVVDKKPVLDENLIKLALWMREQFFCTFFDACKAMLPSGVWHRFDTTFSVADKSLFDEALRLVESLQSGKEILSSIWFSENPCKKKDIEETFGETDVKKVTSVLLEKQYILISEYARKNISDKTEKLVRISVSKEEISEYCTRKRVKPAVYEALNMLETLKVVSVKELCYFTGITPAQLNTLKKNGMIEFDYVEVYRRPKSSVGSSKREIVLNTKQQEVCDAILEDYGKAPACSLLYGVTGSGKTLVYFKLIEKIIEKGKTAILLVPEISLTPQLLGQVYSYFGERTAVMHSALSVGERYDEWKRIKNGEVDVVVGTRSAVFSPLSNIGIIILDEEQEDTYKSSSTPRYHARECAKFRCVTESALLLLGSATPSVESMYHAKCGKYNLHSLPERFNQRPLPEVIISDMRSSLSQGRTGVIGTELYEEIKTNIECGEQTILFLNRRGASKYVVCDECGEIPGCPNCSVPLVFHSKNSRLMCHHCGYSEKIGDKCAKCAGSLRYVGAGTQKVEEELAELFPGIEIVRMDMDTTSGKTSHEQLLNKFRDEKIPILLGTQMITKGLDFENVTLVGVLSADQAVFSENYRAAENAFSLITQVVGRAGRGQKKGRAVIQSYSPNNILICSAAKQDYDEFYEQELILRKVRRLPPFSDLFILSVSAETEFGALSGCMRIAEKLKFVMADEYKDLEIKVLGPAPATIVKVNGRFRYKVIICAKNSKRMRELVSRLVRDFQNDKKNKDMSIIIDINSVDF